MQPLMKEILRLEDQYNYVEFSCDYQDEETWESQRQLSNKIDNLRKQFFEQIKDIPQWYGRQKGKGGYYITGDKILCWGSGIVLFDTKEEVEEAIKIAGVDPEKYDIKLYKSEEND